MATLKTTGTKNTRSIKVREDFFSPDVFVTLEIGDELVSVNRAEILAAIGAVEPTTKPTPPTVTRKDPDDLLVDGDIFIGREGTNPKNYEDEADYYERAGAENRAIANFLRAEQAQVPDNAEIVALTQKLRNAAYNTQMGDYATVARKMYDAGVRV